MDFGSRASKKLTFIPFNDELNSAIDCSEVAAKFLQIHFFSADCRLPPISLSNYKNKHLHRGIIILFLPQLISGKLIWLKIKFDRLKMVSSLNISSFDAAENSQCKKAWQNLALRYMLRHFHCLYSY